MSWSGRKGLRFLANVNSRLRWLYAYFVCLSFATLVCPTQAVEIFGNVSTAFGTLAIRWRRRKILRRLSQGNPSVGRVKHNSGSQI